MSPRSRTTHGCQPLIIISISTLSHRNDAVTSYQTFGKKMIRLTITIILTAILSSCEKKVVKFPYFSEKLNQAAKISSAEHIALRWERNVAWGCFGTVPTHLTLFPLRIKEARVGLGERRVDLHIELDMNNEDASVWREKSTEEERVKICEEACKKPVEDLARMLECDPSLIDLSWGCGAGKVTSPNCNFMSFGKQPSKTHSNPH